ncbi:hypothetical protein ABPG72_021035 [Tetrahymena utriculariae]
MNSRLKFKINELKFDLKAKPSFEDAMSQYYQTPDNPEVILERIFIESEEELFYLFNEYNAVVNGQLFKMKNIIKYYDYHFDDVKKELFILREYSRKTLDFTLQSRRARKNYFKKQELLDFTAQILKVLTQLEENGVILLNLKPTNIFTNEEITYRVGGLARSDNNIWLNAEYLSPELKEDFEKNPSKLPQHLNKNYSKKKAAVYTLGMILLEAATLEDISNVNSIGSSLLQSTKLKQLLDLVEEKYQGYRLFLERFFLPYSQRPDIVECWCMSSDLQIIDGIIMIGDTWNFDKQSQPESEITSSELEEQKQNSESKSTSIVLDKDKGPQFTTVKKRCGGGFYYKKTFKKD